MFKKFLCVFLLLLTACGSQTQEEVIEDKYVDPARDVFLYGELDANTKVLLKRANGNKDFSNYEFKMLNKDIYSEDLSDINGNSIHLSDYDEVVVEIVSVECEHCRKLISNHLMDMLNHEVTLIQYFNVGNENTILDLYDELGIDIPDNLIIVPYNRGMYDYVKDYLEVETYPTLLSFYEGKLSFVATGEQDSDTLDAFYDISFNNRYTNIVDKDGNDLLSQLRDVEDVKNSLSEQNQKKIESIDNDYSSVETTYKIMGSTCDFNKISNNKSDVYVNEIDDFRVYEESNLVLFYTYIKDEEDVDKINFINSLVDSNENYEYIVVLIEGLDSSSSFYKNMDVKFHCPCVSVLGYIPDDFYKVGLAAYPSAFFIRKGTFTGAYSNILDVDTFNKALDIFLSDDCVALLRNN